MSETFLYQLLRVDSIALIMAFLVSFIALNLFYFTLRYMEAQRERSYFMIAMPLLLLFVLIMVFANHLLLLWLSLCLTNFILISLMAYRSHWLAARASRLLAARAFFLATFFIALSFICFYCATGTGFINQIILFDSAGNCYVPIGLVMLLLGICVQSAVWPFHKWLLSSLNSPTQVSALMHAGVLSAGGFLLIRFSRLYVQFPWLLSCMVVIGVVSATLGTTWKLIQHDNKRMLACSTIAQMGFMILQCGLGAFSAAMAHIVCHGFFKAYLFLQAGSAAREKRLELSPISIYLLFPVIASGVIGLYCYLFASMQDINTLDATLFLYGIVFIAAMDIGITILSDKYFGNVFYALALVGLIGLLYGYNVKIMHELCNWAALDDLQFLSIIHVVAFAVMFFSWIIFKVIIFYPDRLFTKKTRDKFYVWALNASQPDPATVTSHHNDYSL